MPYNDLHQTLTCGRCHLDLTEDLWYPSTWKQRSGWCKSCQRNFYRERVAEKPGYFLAYQRARRWDNVQWIKEYKESSGCIQCGFRHHAALDFHHRNGKKNKNMAISKRTGVSRKLLVREIAECDVMCANCHRVKHYEEDRLRKLVAADLIASTKGK